MSDELHRFYVRWSGADRKGVIKIGRFRYEFDRLPNALKGFFDIWFEPPLQMDVRERESDDKREMREAEADKLAEWVRPIGAEVRVLKDMIETR